MKTLEDKISIIFYVLMLIILLFVLSSCSQYIYKSKPVRITHVLAITETGDTLKIPIESIKPNIIYNVIGYNYGRPYYFPYNYNNYDYSRIRPYNGGYGVNTTTPPTSASSVIVKPQGGTSGFTGQPKADNPATRSGGGKKGNN